MTTTTCISWHELAAEDAKKGSLVRSSRSPLASMMDAMPQLIIIRSSS